MSGQPHSTPRPPAVHYSASGAAAFQLLREIDRCSALSGHLSRGRLTLLRALATGGPQTLSDIARARNTSRQSVQRLANALTRAGLLAQTPNPRHRRAPLLALTPAGTVLYRTQAQEEATRLNGLARTLSAEDLRHATRTLKKLRAHAMPQRRKIAR